MATYKRYRKEDQVSYSLGITLTFELLKFKKESVTRVFIHSGMKKGDTLDKLILLCKEANVEMVYTDKIFHVLSQKENCYVIGEFHKFTSKLSTQRNHIVLVNPSNAGNMGTIMRSALGFGMNQMAIIRRLLMHLIRKSSEHLWERYFQPILYILIHLKNTKRYMVKENYIHLCWMRSAACMMFARKDVSH